jgi:hypothetical protein
MQGAGAVQEGYQDARGEDNNACGANTLVARVETEHQSFDTVDWESGSIA